jgi:TM2 domain-containing membrane protein YozV
MATAFTVCHALLIWLLIFVFITYYLFAAQEKVDVIARVRTIARNRRFPLYRPTLRQAETTAQLWQRALGGATLGPWPPPS